MVHALDNEPAWDTEAVYRFVVRCNDDQSVLHIVNSLTEIAIPKMLCSSGLLDGGGFDKSTLRSEPQKKQARSKANQMELKLADISSSIAPPPPISYRSAPSSAAKLPSSMKSFLKDIQLPIYQPHNDSVSSSPSKEPLLSSSPERYKQLILQQGPESPDGLWPWNSLFAFLLPSYKFMDLLIAALP